MATTRYNTLGNPPPYLKEILRDMKSSSEDRRRGFLQRNEIDSIIGSKKGYQRRGTATECRQFLDHHNVFVKDGRNYYFDAARAQQLIVCCEQGAILDACESDSVRLDRLKQQKAQKITPSEPDVPASQSISVPEQEAEQTVVEEPELPVATTMIQSAPKPGKIEVLTRQPAAVIPRFVLFLTPLPQDLWATICDRAEEVDLKGGIKEKRFSIPRDVDAFFKDYASSKIQQSFTAGEYCFALQRFIDARIIDYVHGHENSQFKTFRFVESPELFLDVVVETLPDMIVTSSTQYVVCMLQKQHSLLDDHSKGFKKRVSEFAVGLCKDDVSASSMETRLFSRVRGNGGLGVLYFHKPIGRYLMSWPGFLGVNMVVKDVHEEQPASQPEVIPAVPVQIERKPEVATPSVTDVANATDFVTQTDLVILKPHHAQTLLEMVDGIFQGRLNTRFSYATIKKFRACGWLTVEPDKETRTKSQIQPDKICYTRFQFGYSNVHVGKDTLNASVPRNQWRMDLEAIAKNHLRLPRQLPSQRDLPEDVAEPHAVDMTETVRETSSFETLRQERTNAAVELDAARKHLEDALRYVEQVEAVFAQADQAYRAAIESKRTALEQERLALQQRLAEITTSIEEL